MVKYVYDAWGNHAVEVLDSTCAELSQLNPYRYRGYYYDTETGLYFLKTRYYDSEIGRFITIDGLPMLSAKTLNGLNLYAYCANNPVMNIDPMGTSWWNRLKAGFKSWYSDIKSSWNNFWSKENLINIGEQLTQLPVKIGDTVTAFVENSNLSVGVGMGIGLSINIFQILAVSFMFKADPISFQLDKNGFKFGGAVDKSMGISFLGAAIFSIGLKVFSQNWKMDFKEPIIDTNLSIGAGAYFIFGGEISYGLNVHDFWKEVRYIWGI